MDRDYLNKQSQDVVKSDKEVVSSHLSSFDSDEVYDPTSPVPWRRYFARSVDMTIGVTVLAVIFDMIFPFGSPLNPSTVDINLRYLVAEQITFIVLISIYLVIEAGIISRFGTTFGKWLFNIRIHDSKGYDPETNNYLSFSASLKRDFLMFVKGYGLGIILVTTITSFIQYFNVSGNKLGKGRASWDKNTNAVMVHSELTNWKLVIVIILFIGNVILEYITKYA